ncbi:MAG: hypothetical protein JW929_05190 [Anaerolineales bacterium]|nr:hypothetical protein [Anaerolineales bacterium]
MRKKTWLHIGAAGALAVMLSACDLLPSTPTPFQFPTPNWTMSKLFEVPTAKPKGTDPAGTPQFTATISPTAPDCTNLGQLVGSSIPDMTKVAPGTAFMQTWTIKNIGTCQWGKGYSLVFDHGDRMDGPQTVPLTASVPAGAVYVFAVNLVAPSLEGEYQGFWKIQTPQGVRFGVEPEGETALGVKIQVAGSSPCEGQNQRPDENGEPVQAVYAVYPPVIDGKLEDWEDPLSFSISAVVSGNTENKARFGLRWDNSYMYIAVKVSDGEVVQETSGGANLFKGDSLEILLDANLGGDFCDIGMSSDDFQLGISPGYLQDPSLQGPSAYLWYPTGRKGGQIFKISASLTPASGPKGWILEARIPWLLFGVAPTGGESYGFAVSVTDNDHYGTTQLDGMISSAPRRVTPSNPMLWGTLQIIGR